MTGNDAMSDNDVLRAVSDSVSAIPVASRPPVAQITHRSRAQRRRWLLPAAGALVTAGAAAAAVTLAMPASHQPQIRLDAWTVSKQTNGNIQVTINQLQNPSGLQSTLRADGVPASVTFGQQNPACQHYPQSSPAAAEAGSRHPSTGPLPGPSRCLRLRHRPVRAAQRRRSGDHRAPRLRFRREVHREAGHRPHQPGMHRQLTGPYR